MYRRLHLTETALVKVHSDISRAMDNGDIVILVMLALSAKFNTLDHQKMLNRLQRMYSIEGQALQWIESYLDLRTQCVKLLAAESSDQTLTFVMLQGSVLAAKMYCLYSRPVGFIIKHNDMDYHVYADDSQIYLVIKRSDISSTIHRVENCVHDIKGWMETNLLKLNEDKTEVIVFGSQRKQHLLQNIVPLVSLCSSQHGLKQIKLCFKSRAGCEAALRSDGRLCLQSYYAYSLRILDKV